LDKHLTKKRHKSILSNNVGNALPKKKKQTRLIPLLVIVAFIVIITLIIPVFPQQRLNVSISQDKIIDASAETVNVPLISTFFTRPSNEGTGVYTIKADFGPTSYFINNVPIGTYTFVLVGEYNGIYEVKIFLSRGTIVVDMFTINATY